MSSNQTRRHLPRALLDELFRYEPETGRLFWKIDYGRHKAGQEARHRSQPRRDGRDRIYVGLGGVQYSAHVLIWIIMTGEPPQQEIDHIDRNAQNNRWANLREVSRGKNQTNTNLYVNNKSGFRGVSAVASRDVARWRAIISIGGKNRHLGFFDSRKEAAKAYRKAARGALR